MMTTTGDPRALALDVSPLGGAEHPRGIHCMTIVARHALSPSTPRACGATLRASGVDCSARPSKEGYHAMNADTCLVLLTPDQFGQEKARKISLRRKISLTWGASYKPPA